MKLISSIVSFIKQILGQSSTENQDKAGIPIEEFQKKGVEKPAGTQSSDTDINAASVVRALEEMRAEEDDIERPAFTVEEIVDHIGAEKEDSTYRAFVSPTNAIHRNSRKYLAETDYVDIARVNIEQGNFREWAFTLVKESELEDMKDKFGEDLGF
jgi:hypothetical protein